MHVREQRVQRQHPAVLGDVGLLVPGRGAGVAVAPALPGAAPDREVELGQVGVLEGGDRALPVGRPVDPAVVDADRHTVGGQPDVALQRVSADLHGPPVRCERVLGEVLGRATVSHDHHHGNTA